MARPRKTKISLPKLACLTETGPEGKARKVLRDFKRSGYRDPDGPTVERLMRAGESARVETFSEVVEVSRGDAFEQVEVNFTRMRLDDGPLARLRDRGQLDRDDKARNLALAMAGEKFRQAYFRSGLDPLHSLDPTREVATAYAPGAMWRSESQVEALQRFRAARDAIPEDFRSAVSAIVLEDREIVDVGRETGAYRDAKMAGAVALFILRRGLAALARHYRMISAADAA
ncbi:hypothetical protein SAMN06265338_101751 [Rhodoblastus acidophilus]|uniref:Uncharacterized protein n=1 Tax=Rhodoblastus acidophilus TaxID=1074 RepID=A0A212QLG6_RHOAC|nr:hypothetical protein [Rhodoblastus acidophilus]MCW2317663.1 hypothetical protein [Rhodoblastus acidophilus]PPQ39850.1 hypothetical protein CKO16_03330 [Rhodoblastus acidophilus]RAI23826.1 hypothetical protein CH337_02940 [Rhodoblastus acidophilus]SNB60195.1 hypothetical protein SAMN06265338_101751 [Rhodoblastus acidophilus]